MQGRAISHIADCSAIIVAFAKAIAELQIECGIYRSVKGI